MNKKKTSKYRIYAILHFSRLGLNCTQVELKQRSNTLFLMPSGAEFKVPILWYLF